MDTIPGVAVIGSGYWGRNLVRNFGSLGITVKSAAKPLACPAKSLKTLGGVLNPVSFSRQFPKSRNFHALGALRAVCDSNEQVLAALQTQYEGIATTPSFAEVLEDPTVQCLAIAAPAVLHASLVRQALLAGKDVLVEKPLALTEEDGKILVQLARGEDGSFGITGVR